MLLTIHFPTYSQNGGINGWIKKQSDKLNDGINKVFNGSPNQTNGTNTSNGATIEERAANGKKGENGKVNSELNESAYYQVKGIPEVNPSNTRFKIAQNLMVDVKGKYPGNYQPKWRFISYNSQLNMSVENWIVPSSGLQSDQRNISIADYNGKAVLRFGAFITCDCYADIVIKNGSALITSTPQTFKVANFQKIQNERTTGEPCVGIGNRYTDGGWEGKLTLSANDNGDIMMDLMIENYTVGYQPSFQKAYAPSAVSYRYIAKSITIENEMSAEKAIGIIEAEKQAKQKQKDYILKTTKQADELEKAIAKKYPQAECRSCFYSSRGSYISSQTYDKYFVESGEYAGSSTDYDLNTVTVIKNTCNHDITFVGIQQLYSEAKGYYLTEVTKTMKAGYSYKSDQGIASSLLTSLIGGGSEFNFAVQDKYAVNYAYVGSVQWIKVIKSK